MKLNNEPKPCPCGESHYALDLFRLGYPMTEGDLLEAGPQAARCEKRRKSKAK